MRLDQKIINRRVDEALKTNASILDLSYPDPWASPALFRDRSNELPISIAQLTQLKQLYLGGNQLVALPKFISQLKQLEVLDLSNNRLTELPAYIAEFQALKALNLTNTQLTTNPLLIGKLKKMQVLRLHLHKDLLHAPLDFIGELKQLKVLFLYHAQLTTIPDFITGLLQLQALSLQHVQLTTLPKSITFLKQLKLLNLSHNQLISLPNFIGELTQLQELRLCNNQLKTLPESITKLKLLQTLDIQDNQFEAVPPNIANLQQLTSLFLRGIQLTEIPEFVTKLKQLKMLGFGGMQLKKLPDEIAELKELQWLNLRDNQITTLPDSIGNLTQLRSLDLAENNIKLLPNSVSSLVTLEILNLSSNELTELPPVIAKLQQLKELYLAINKLTALDASIGNLRKLELLWLRANQLSALPESIGKLEQLKKLYLDSNLLVKLPDQIGELKQLEELTLNHNRLKNLPDSIGQLKQLNILGIFHNQLAAIPESITDLKRLKELNLGENPVERPPKDIAARGINAIREYFEQIKQQGFDHLYEAKLIIVGDPGVGKTSLLRRLYQPDQPLPTERETTKGIAIYRHTYPLKNGRNFHLNVWDFGGQQIYHATHQFFLTRRSLYLLVDDTGKDHKSVSDAGFKYWLELIDLFSGHSPVLIFQNEKGGRSKAIDLAGIKGVFDNVKELYAGNLEHSNAADELRDGIEYFASNLSHIGEELPSRWIKVREDIELLATKAAYITQKEYFDIYGQHMAFDRSKALHLSRYLHDLGVFLHFQDEPLLTRIIILQNEWATEAVFGILDDEIIKSKLGRFSDVDCKRLWRDSVYVEMHPELLALMQRFELCYELMDSQPRVWLAPQLLPPAKPTALDDWGEAEDLVLRYHYDFMPKGLISRLTVRLHRFVRDPEMAWVTGVLFEHEDIQVLVELLVSGDEIELRARGPERKALLNVVAADLDALNDSFEGLRDKVDKRIPCNCTRCRAAAEPEFFAQRRLLKRKEDRRLKVECPSSYEDVDVLELLDGIRLDTLPGWTKEDKTETPQRIIKIFLASSAELKEDRDAFDLYFRQLNDQLRKELIYLQIVRWEHFLDAMSETRLQDEYNKAVRDCDIFVSLLFTKTGKFTEEEFDTAHHQFKDAGSPQIYTFFKNAEVLTGDIDGEVLSLLQFKKKLADLGHFYTSYSNIDDLKLQFRDQLDKLLG